MAFYLNEFKKHLQSLSDKVDHPYDEPARRGLNNKTTGSLEEAYSAMKQPRMGSYQRPEPSMLNEAGSQSLNEQGYWGTPDGAKVNFNRPGGFDGIVYWFPTGDPADGGMIHPDYKGTPGWPDQLPDRRNQGMPSGRKGNWGQTYTPPTYNPGLTRQSNNAPGGGGMP